MILHNKSPATVMSRGQGFFKKVACSLLLLLSISQIMPFATAWADPVKMQTRVYYIPWRDEYRVDFNGPGSYQFGTFRVFFEVNEPSEMTYESIYQYYTGIMYLTCNGTYTFYFTAPGDADTIIMQSDPIVTTQINNPACQSYPDGDGGAHDDLTGWYTEDDQGRYTVHWDDLPGAGKYEIWLNGDLVGTVDDPGDGFELPHGGSVSIVAYDDDGDYLGHSDLQVPDFDGQPDWGDDPGAGKDCDICDLISDVLACPGWDDYMGAWSDMLSDIIPPPPDWDYVADTISTAMIDALDDWLGDMPPTPSREDLFDDLDTELPDVDVPVPDLVPDMPSDYDEPFEFDITDGEQIDIVDESEPFEIVDPLHDYDHDDPGVMVYPNDPRNHSDGIKDPDQITTDAPTPIPTMPPPGDDPPDQVPTPTMPPDDPEIPPAIIPIPERPYPPDVPIP